MSSESWRTVAITLANRLQYADFCDNGHAEIADGVAAGCPNCYDRAAFARFIAKYGSNPFELDLTGVRDVSVYEIRNSPPS